MKTIKNTTVKEYVVNKSRFICILCNIDSIDEVNEKIVSYKKEYKDATHYCFAYIYDGYMKCDDDGEPSGTAGMPILNVLKSNDLEHVLCIVIRYFGGVKLGAGGLVRAYNKSACLALDDASLANIMDGYYVEILFDYDLTKIIDSYLKDILVIKNFGEKVKYSFKIDINGFNRLENLLCQSAEIIKKEPVLLIV